MLLRTLSIFVILTVFSISSFAATWTIDKAHSTVGFSVRHMVISKTKGFFKDYDGTIEFDGENLETGKVNVTIKIASIDTDNKDRDNHLLQSEFFDEAKFPTMNFVSKKITKGADGEFKMVGDLTIKDVTKEVTLDCEFNGSVDDPWGNTRAGFTASTTINRQDYNITFNNALKDGSLAVGNDVKIELEIELIKDK